MEAQRGGVSAERRQISVENSKRWAFVFARRESDVYTTCCRCVFHPNLVNALPEQRSSGCWNEAEGALARYSGLMMQRCKGLRSSPSARGSVSPTALCVTRRFFPNRCCKTWKCEENKAFKHTNTYLLHARLTRAPNRII